MPTRLFAALIAAAINASAVLAQQPALRVERDGRAPASLTLDALRRLPSDTIVSESVHNAPPVRYRAVKLGDVLTAAGSPLDSLRIGRAGWIVVADASDGYAAVFSAAEIEPTIGPPSRVFVAYARENGPLTDKEGPFHLVVPTDQRSTRSARLVTRIRILDALQGAKRP